MDMYSNILVPIDPAHGDVARRIIAVAKLLAGDSGRITLLTVLEPVPKFVANYIPDGTLDSNRRDSLARLKATADAAGLKDAATELRDGSPANTILEVAERQGCDAIVLGSHRPEFATYLIGSTAARVVRHAQCTVVVERSEDVSA